MWAVALSALLAVLGYGPTVRRGGPLALEAMWVALAISVVSSLAGGLVVAAAASAPEPSRRATAALAGMFLRLVLAALLAGAAILSGRFQSGPLLIWLAVSYVVLLAADTRYTLSALRGGR